MAATRTGRNASENPAGIETYPEPVIRAYARRRNASENPAGIETEYPIAVCWIIRHVATHQKTQQGLKLIAYVGICDLPLVATHQKTQQGLKLNSV